MLDNYLIIHKCILPAYYEKVAYARRLVEQGKAKDVSQAVKMAEISRSTYYKYKDYILEPSEIAEGRKAVISVMLAHETGVLSSLIACIPEVGGSVLTITQSLPVHGLASVTLCIDISAMTCQMAELIKKMESIPGVQNPKLIALD